MHFCLHCPGSPAGYKMRSSLLIICVLVVTSSVATDALFAATALTLGGLAALKGAALVGFAAGRHKGHYEPYFYVYDGEYPHAYQGVPNGEYHGVYHTTYYGHHTSQGDATYNYRHKRSAAEDDAVAAEGEDLLLSAVGQLDPNGCVLKLLCHIRAKEISLLSPEENQLIKMFEKNSAVSTPYKAAFIYAADIGEKTRDTYACKRYFSKCPLQEEELGALLVKAWGCNFDLNVDKSTGNLAVPLPHQTPVLMERMQPVERI
ncbi:hypothetical protein SK128_010377 [Halocaridina rubra]|uniref:Uncharacterized protein n=1 Tax=Halocaridina rubra TaxID=373956 RepID=A0AAN8WBY6_HALRR